MSFAAFSPGQVSFSFSLHSLKRLVETGLIVGYIFSSLVVDYHFADCLFSNY